MRPLLDIIDPGRRRGDNRGNQNAQKLSGTAQKNVLLAQAKAEELGYKPTDPIVVDMHSSRMNWANGYSPCLTASRAASGGHWLLWAQRSMTTHEMMRLMGLRNPDCRRPGARGRSLAVIALGIASRCPAEPV